MMPGRGITDEFVERARAVSVAEAASRLGLRFLRGRSDHAQPCPVSGGRDRFSFRSDKDAWKCRSCGEGGRDAIGMAAHVIGADLKRRDGFIAACEAVLGEAAPDPDDRESDEQRANRERRLARIRAENEQRAKARDADNNAYRAAEQGKARGKWLRANNGGRTPVERYLSGRSGAGPMPEFARFSASESYFHGVDERGGPIELHSGPAMILPFVEPDGLIIGCHITWIDLDRRPKLRPEIGLDERGNLLPTKKMRGTKKGGLIPLWGFRATGQGDAMRILPENDRRRWVGGEGIETTRAVAVAEGIRRDTCYFAAGDLGNLAGPADPASAFPHPNLTFTDRRGREMPVRVQGSQPKAGQGPDDALQIPESGQSIVLLADGDSEFVWTASTMARARNRLSISTGGHRRSVEILWPPEGMDFADMAVSRQDVVA